jgi:hypothetical protein
MSARDDAARRFSLVPGPAGIVIGYVLALFAVVAGTVVHPFSSIWMILLFMLVGAFFVVAVSVIVMRLPGR